MKQIYFTLTGTQYCFGQKWFEAGQKVRLEKEPDNEVDTEAIVVKMAGLGKVGYVANSIYTVLGESMSAGRLYDKIGAAAEGTVKYVLPNGVLCELDPKSVVCREGMTDEEQDFDEEDEEDE